MRKFPNQLGQQTTTDYEKPKTATIRMQAPLRDAVNCGNSPADSRSVRPFELQSLDENLQPRSQGLRQLVREELELLRKQEQRQVQDAVREIRSELCQLRDSLDDKPDRKALDNYLNARLQQLSLEAHAKNTELKGLMGHLQKSFGEKLQSAQNQIEAVGKQLIGDSKAARKNTFDTSKIQMMESNIEFLFERIDSLTENRSSRSVHKYSQNGENSDQSHSSPNRDHFDRQIHSLRTQLKLEMTELTNGFCSLEEQLQEYSKQLKQKISTPDLNEALEELRERTAQTSSAIDKINGSLYELHEERENTERMLSRLQERVGKCLTAVESTVPELKLSVEEQLADLSSQVEQRFARIISSYNGNFQQIDENNHQLKEMISEILSINSVLTQKLVGAITNKLDCMTFQSTIEHLNEQISSTLCLNTRKIRQIGDKEFEVEHQLKSLKEVLGNLKHDYERNYNRLKDNDERSSFGQSDRKSMQGRKSIRDVSPLLMSPLVDDRVRFRRNEGMYEAVGGRYNSSHQRRPLYNNRSVSELEEFEPEAFHIGSYSKMPSLSDELASLS